MDDESLGLTSGQTVPPRRPFLSSACQTIALLLLGLGAGLSLAALLSVLLPGRAMMFIAENAQPDALAASQSALSFLVVGDWGRNGDYNQSLVAEAMGRVASSIGSSFVISTGDNFYDDGLSDIQDPAFSSSFTEIYQATSLRTQWYAVLGNHDYHRNADAQTNPALRFRDPRWHCERTYTVRHDACPKYLYEVCDSPVEFFFIDTSPFVAAYWKGKPPEFEKLNFTGFPDYTLTTHYQLQKIRNALSLSTAKWKVVIGHHPIRGTGTHGNTKELQQMLYPLLKKHKVDFYLNGHDHNLEMYKDPNSPMFFLTSGAGSKVDRQRNVLNDSNSMFYHSRQGFASATIEGKNFQVNFHDIIGNTIYSITVTK